MYVRHCDGVDVIKTCIDPDGTGGTPSVTCDALFAPKPAYSTIACTVCTSDGDECCDDINACDYNMVVAIRIAQTPSAAYLFMWRRLHFGFGYVL